MFKKVIKGIAIGAAVLGMFAGQSIAADYEINIYGASAQHKFWLNLAPDFLTNVAGCDTNSITQTAVNSKHGMAYGENCNTYGTGTSVLIRYSSQASYAGINAVSVGGSKSMCAEDANHECTSLTSVQVNLGASDVAGTSFKTGTAGYVDGDQDTDEIWEEFNSLKLGFPTASTIANLQEFNPIVVPFGFLVNNKATEYRCAKPAPTEDTTVNDKAYDKYGWSCVPNSNYVCSDANYTNQEDCEANDATWDLVSDNAPRGASGVSTHCIGYYKCLNGACNGGLNSGTPHCSNSAYTDEETCELNEETWYDGTCTVAQDCPDVELADTYCKEVPVNNLTQTMAQRIFSGSVNNWSAFGPSYTSCPIMRCMRHSGSGTHATMNLAVMDGQTLVSDSDGETTWHYESSSDLTKCVTNFDCAVGYVDADKLLTFSGVGDVEGAHIAKYNGVEPTRANIVNGTYEFWAAQHVYYRDQDFASGTVYKDILDDMIDYSSNSANLTTATLGNAAYFWAAQEEMTVGRAGDGEAIK
ncbi:substrate-binding domain-containing protein [uncultured Desulfosarcina sp.]|uniref:substrate-binding domain-containing protein n=1 Tax=uncultured Desulfosarcina sp. TaxID=218289 RepID=UPI0029C64191|nr:substrate-binding domain-containing protein [uncultured Desulfosarcina sp.]